MASVLVVDDDADVLELLIDAVTLAGHTVYAASDGLSAIHIAHHIDVRLVILDLMMPHMDGYEVLAQFHGDPQLTNVPIVIVSGVSLLDITRAATATAFIPKPLDVALLNQFLRSIV
jgi:adenylate cyclase